MKRELRIGRVWFYGKLTLAKKIHLIQLYERLLNRAKAINPLYEYMAPKDYEKIISKAMCAYLSKLIPPKRTT